MVSTSSRSSINLKLASVTCIILKLRELLDRKRKSKREFTRQIHIKKKVTKNFVNYSLL